MNEEELTRAMRDATADLSGPRTSFTWVAANGRRRLRRRRLGGLAAGVALLAASLGAVALADSDAPGQSVRAAGRPSTTSGGRARQPGRASPSTSTIVVGRPHPTEVPPATKPWIPGPTRATVVPTTPRPTVHPPHTVPTTIPPATDPPATVAPPGSRPVMRPAANGDVDGDGIVDKVGVVEIGKGRAEVRATLSAVGKQTVVIDLPGGAPVAVMGVSDIDGDGFGEVFVRVGSGASTVQGSILRLVGDRLGLVRISDGAGGTSSTFLVDGSVKHLYSFECVVESDWVTLTEAHPTDDTLAAYDVTYRTYRFEKFDLALVKAEVRRTAAAEVPNGMQVECGLPQNW